jgi:hypothetical protein
MKPTDKTKEMSVRRLLLSAACVVMLFLLGSGCVHTVSRSLVTPDRTTFLDSRSPFLKVHMKNGSVYVLDGWKVDEGSRIVSGKGQLLDAARQPVQNGVFSLAVDSVALFETNVLKTSPTVTAMAIITGVSVGVTIICITNPKACFGSCPTFYTADNGTDLLQAEGFSASVAPCLEATDIDALYRSRPSSRDYRIIMKNEALETHVVQYVDLLAARRPDGGRVAKDMDGRFWQVANLRAPKACAGPNGDFVDRIREFDSLERFSNTDSSDLAARESIELSFDPGGEGSVGLMIGARQTLLSTFLFYQLLAYMGSRTSDFFTALEQGNEASKNLAGSIGHELGGIDVYGYARDGSTVGIGTVGETGPLGTDLWMIRIPDSLKSSGRLSLQMTKGGWRLNYIAIADVGSESIPERIHASTVYHNGADTSALRRLCDTTDYLVTQPGDEYQIVYGLPNDYSNYELFLESRGYYLEWMRQEWLAEEDFGRAVWLLTNPRQALVDLAPEFKKHEPEIEQMFWNSKYVR